MNAVGFSKEFLSTRAAVTLKKNCVRRSQKRVHSEGVTEEIFVFSFNSEWHNLKRHFL